MPTEAQIYREKFLRCLDGLRKNDKEKFKDVEDPVITLEDKSFSTLTNIKEVLQMIKDRGWKKVALVTSAYHVPRARALYEQALKQHEEIQVSIDFLSAEKIAKKTEPGKYDEFIEMAYQSTEAQKRISNEKKGLEDIKAGRYAAGEFQLEEGVDK